MIEFSIIGRRNTFKDTTLYYLTIAPVKPLGFDEVAEQIERQCTVATPDIKAVLNALEYVIFHALRNGQSVRLGDIGSFRPTISCKGVEKLEDATLDKVRAVRCRYTASARMYRELQLKNLSLQKAAAKKPEGGSGEATA